MSEVVITFFIAVQPLTYTICSSMGILFFTHTVPGIIGNQIEAKLNKSSVPHFWCSKNSDWYTLWLEVTELLPGEVDCFADNIK